MNDLDPKNLYFDIRGNLFYGEFRDDGTRALADAFNVIAETPNGRRFMHFKTYDTVQNPADAEQLALKLMERVARAAQTGEWEGPLHNPHWVEIDPAYGSVAWVYACEEYEIRRENEEEW